MSSSEKKVALCVSCRAEFTAVEIGKARCCPRCGSSSVPADPRLKSKLELTHHEWRILFIWASNYANTIGSDPVAGSLAAIIREVKRQDPNLPSLTLREEVQGIANAFGKVSVSQGGVEEVVNPEQKH